MGTAFDAQPAPDPQLGDGHAANLREQFNALVADVTALRTAFTTLTAKLDGDAGISDTDYADGDPAALTVEDLTAV